MHTTSSTFLYICFREANELGNTLDFFSFLRKFSWISPKVNKASLLLIRIFAYRNCPSLYKCEETCLQKYKQIPYLQKLARLAPTDAALPELWSLLTKLRANKNSLTLHVTLNFSRSNLFNYLLEWSKTFRNGFRAYDFSICHA